jgi:hypothetical protein
MGTVMTGVSICLSRIGRQFRTAYRPGLAVIFLCAAWLTATAAPSGDETAPNLELPLSTTDQLVSIRNVELGRESVVLSARMTEKSLQPLVDVRWMIKSSAGEVLVDTKTDEVQAELPPGEYAVTAVYGHKSITEPLTLPEGSRLKVSYVLNTGVLRVLPRIGGGQVPGLVSTSKVFSLDGDVRGALITTSTRPGEILNLPEGSYRIESRFVPGNTQAVMDVKVKPGIQTAVDVDHVAGTVKLGLVNASAATAWRIAADDGSYDETLTGSEARLTLRPGRYIATATEDGQSFEMTFDVTDGVSRDITLGQ